jgi:hypothetical protein
MQHGFIWLRIRSSERNFVNMVMKFRVPWEKGTFRVAELLAVPEEGLSSMELLNRVSFPVYFFPLWRFSPNLGLGLPLWNSLFHFGFLDLRQSVWLSARRKASTCTQTLNIHALSWVRTHDPGFRASEDNACLRPLGYRNRLPCVLHPQIYIFLQELNSLETLYYIILNYR